MRTRNLRTTDLDYSALGVWGQSVSGRWTVFPERRNEVKDSKIAWMLG